MAGEPVLLVCDLFLREGARRKGLGKHLMMLCDLVSRKQALAGVMVAVLRDDASVPFFASQRGFEEDPKWRAQPPPRRARSAALLRSDGCAAATAAARP